MVFLGKIRASIKLIPLISILLYRIFRDSNCQINSLAHAVKKIFKNTKTFNSNSVRNLELILKISEKNLDESIEFLGISKGQLGQDIFVLAASNFSTGGYFVEFGATNGIDLSNTYLLEKYRSWNGILAEPAKIWHSDLIRNRSVSIEQKCVWSKSGMSLNFNETESPELSTIQIYSDTDIHKESRSKGVMYEVKTISLTELLEKYNAPQVIDYLSIDTEGSEFEILSSLDFGKIKFKFITCEHNGTAQRNDIFELLSRNRYARVLTSYSQFDDWYINTDLVKNASLLKLIET